MTNQTFANKRIHLGCGLNTPTDWINVDGSWNARFAKYPLLTRLSRYLHVVPSAQLSIPWNPDILIHDLRKPLPFPTNSISAVYTSHTLEHLYLDEAQNLLRESFRVLQAGGVLRVVVPDVRAIVDEYVSQEALPNSPDEVAHLLPADRLNRRLLLRSPHAPSGNMLYRWYSTTFDFHSHKWMYDKASLMHHFIEAGFIDVQDMAFHDSRIEDIENIELAERVLNGAGICVEGIKPEQNNSND
ncbi:MAG: methyltransferase domain-containing protein [Anaerolineae bacterium]